ncbi:fatty acid-binding protein, heart isoform X1 [Callorhinchus milii]|uniref:fatty acid-binding protein, heart isoform X1 n=1 Tax=Callorhinchus milii TaxID=7868 RepID=UPI001C3FBDFE|nr:fatty acid-binding protein, heart isoform X1 [Callorhinchus milii]
MVEVLEGTWRMIESTNFDAYMRALGVNFKTRQVGNVSRPTTVIKVDANLITLKTMSTFKSTEINFQLDREFNEITADGRDVKSLVTWSNGKLIHIQKWNGRQTTLLREIKDSYMILTLTLDDVVCTRKYEKA